MALLYALHEQSPTAPARSYATPIASQDRRIAAARARELQLVRRGGVRQAERVPAGSERLEAHVPETMDRAAVACVGTERVATIRTAFGQQVGNKATES